jgi:integrase
MKDAADALGLGQDPTAHIVFPTTCEDEADEDEDEAEDSANTLNAEELPRFLAALRKKRPGQYALVATLATTGLRFCHASALRWTDIDEARGIIRIRRKNARARVGKVTRKKNAPRRYPLHPELAEILRGHRAYLLKRQHRGLAHGWCFPSKTGGLQRPSSLSKCFTTALTLAGIKKHITPHSLRRSFVDLNRLAGVTGLVTKSLTGHATDRMLEHYSTPQLAEQRHAVGTVVDLLKAKSGYPGGDPTNLKKRAAT